MRDYDYYLSACRQTSELPMHRWQFCVAYSLYRHLLEPFDFNRYADVEQAQSETGETRQRKNYLSLIPWTRFRELACLVDRGRALAQSESTGFDDDGQAGGPGVREPRRPKAPILSGSAARSIEPPVYEYDRVLVH